MVSLEIVDSELVHVRQLSYSIREKDKKEAEALGLVAHRALYHTFRHAVMRRTCLIDGSVAAMWGVCGTPLGMVGQPYLVTGKLCEEVSPLTFARIYTKEAQEMRNLFPVLENYVHADYDEAVRMLKIAGFELSEPLLINNNKFLRFSMRSN